jgi:manganese oxidase
MGETGMDGMTQMQMPLPDNTLPMMTGTGPFGAIGMGGMFTVVKVRDGVAPGDFKDPGWFAHPKGTVAHEFEGEVAEPARAPYRHTDTADLQVRRPAGHGGH